MQKQNLLKKTSQSSARLRGEADWVRWQTNWLTAFSCIVALVAIQPWFPSIIILNSQVNQFRKTSNHSRGVVVKRACGDAAHSVFMRGSTTLTGSEQMFGAKYLKDRSG